MGPEQALLIASTGAGLEDLARQRIEAALAGQPDWTSVVTMALEHGMTPALLDALDLADQFLVPSDLLATLREHCNILRDRSLYLVGELHAILASLHQQAVPAIAFKGPVLAKVLFDDVGKRVPRDLDLLVSRADVSRTCELLEARGYVDSALLHRRVILTPAQHTMYRRYQCEYQYVRVSDGVIVEPHWAFAQRMLAIDCDYRAMFDRAHTILLEGHPVRSLATEDMLLALCIHGGKHRWERLTWIRDVAALLARSPDLDFDRCLAVARSTGCTRLLLLGLTLARRCAGVRSPGTIDRLIENDSAVQDLEDQVMRRLFDPDRQPVDNAIVDRFAFQMRERWRDRMRYLRRTLLMPRLEHIQMVVLPPALRWAYYPLRWAHDYVALPLWRLASPVLGTRTDYKQS